jgi:hypothetical protein
VINGEIKVNNVKKAKLVARLVELKFVKMSDMPQIKSSKANEILRKIQEAAVKDSDDAEDGDGEVGEGGEGLREVKAVEYDYLLTMRISSLTYEKVEKIKGELVEKETQLTKMQGTTIEALWLSDLDQFSEKLDAIEAKQEKDWAKVDKLKKAPKQGKLVGKKKKNTEKNKEKSDDNPHNPFIDKVKGRKGGKKAPKGTKKGRDTDSDSAEEPRVIKKPVKPRKKKVETTTDPNKAPVEDSIVIIEEKIPPKKPETALQKVFRENANKDNHNGDNLLTRLLKQHPDIIGATSSDRNGTKSVPFIIDDEEPIKKVKTNEPKLRSKPTKKLQYDLDSDNQSSDDQSSDDYRLMGNSGGQGRSIAVRASTSRVRESRQKGTKNNLMIVEDSEESQNVGSDSSSGEEFYL